MATDAGTPQTDDSGVDETRQRILHAAAQVFQELGYTRATTRAIAARADVNEVTLFRHFGSKERLFQAVIEAFGAPALSTDLTSHLAGDYRQDLLQVGNHLMTVLLERREALRLMLCEASHFPEVQAMVAQNPRELRRLLARYFQEQIERGRVRDLDPEAMAHAFLGVFFSYAISLEILAEPVRSEVSKEELVEQFVDIFVGGTARLDG